MASTRREFLVAATGVALLTACGASSDGNATGNTVAGNPVAGDTTTPAATSDTLPAGFEIVQRFSNGALFTPGDIRLPVSISDGQNLVTTGPGKVSGWIEDFNQQKITDVTAVLRNVDIVVPYWEVRATLPKAVIYTLRLEGDDGYGATFEVFDPADVASPLTGKPMPPFDTPTVDDHRGVEPYCSLTPDPCPLHDVTLTDALKSGKPVAYMVGTPAHCQTATCAPGLLLLVAEHESLGDAVVMVHADVYADDAATKVAPAVEALGVDYEPIIYFCDASGVVVDRLDGIWDKSELRERLALLTGS